MKKITFILLAILLYSSAYAQQTAMEAWKPLLNRPGLAEYFNGIFTHLGIRVKETGEEFTVHHKEKYFELTKGINTNEAEFIAEIKMENMTNMVLHGTDSVIDENESFRIMRILFTPLTQTSLNSPYLTNKKYLKAAGTEELIHVILLDPEKKEDYAHTLAYAAGQWLVIQGLHGKPARTFKLTPSNAIEYQRHLYAAKKKNTSKAWMEFAQWYKKWKSNVSQPHNT